MKSRFFGTAVVGLIGAIVGSFSMMLFASTHFTGIAGPGNTPPVVSAAPLTTGVSDQDRIVNAVKRVSPSVVALNVTINGSRVVPIDPFSQFFGGPSINRVMRYQQRASGSGFVYSKTGLIVTNAHVVPVGTSSVEVVFRNGDRVKGHVYARNPAVDLALVKVDNYAKLPPPIEVADGNNVQAGQWAIAIGEPFELKQSVSIGIVSGFNRDEPIGDESGQVREFKGLLQTSAPINPGNSGGPLIDFNGRLIGVNQSTANPQNGAQGIGFAIPVDTMKQQVALLEKNPGITLASNNSTTSASYIGAQLQGINDNIRSQTGYQGKDGVLVVGVFQGAPADQAGLQAGDIVISAGGKTVDTPEDLTKIVRATKAGSSLELQVFSNGVKRLVNVKVQEEPQGYENMQVPQTAPGGP
jgi:serine protease Do